MLLKNDGLLPLDPDKLDRVAVVGPNADETTYALTHYGPLAVEVTSVLAGLKDRLEGKAEVVYAKGCDLVDYTWPLSEIIPADPRPEDLEMMEEAVEQVENSDVAIVVLGGGQRTCGENKSRTSLELPGFQNDLLKAVKATGKPVIVVLINGRPLSVNYADAAADAMIEAWYPGAHGGQAVAEVICGDYNPGGKLTVTFPKTVGQIQSRINGALYDFGYGLSYTTFAYSGLELSADVISPDDSVVVAFDVTNTGDRAGDEVVQLYIHDCLSSVTVYEKQLRGFDRIHLEPGETRHVEMLLTPASLSLLDLDMNSIVEPGDFDIMIGASSTDIRLQTRLTVTSLDRHDQVAGNPPANSGVKLPLSMKAGDEYIISVENGAELDSVILEWGKGSSCEFRILYTAGGGQFLPISGYSSAKGKQVCEFAPVTASELKIIVTDGQGLLKDVRID